MSDIDEERLQTLMELVNKENPDFDPYDSKRSVHLRSRKTRHSSSSE